jgi:hypothetical protein
MYTQHSLHCVTPVLKRTSRNIPQILGHWAFPLHELFAHKLEHFCTILLMVYRASPNYVTGYSPFYLLHGRELEIPNNDSLKARVARGDSDLDRSVENLKARLKKTYKFIADSNRKSRQRNKKLYDRNPKSATWFSSTTLF